jgi:hypothetical protein
MANEPAALREMIERLNGLLERVCLRDTPHFIDDLEEIRGDCYELFGRWLNEGKLRPNESLPYLARRLWKQCGEAHLQQLKREGREVAIVQDLPTGEQGTPHWMERELAQAAAMGDPEQALACKSAAEWLLEVRAKLTPAELETFDAEARVERGDADTLHEALGVDDATARKRRERLREKLTLLAAQGGREDILERAKGARAVRRDKGPTTGRRKWLK